MPLPRLVRLLSLLTLLGCGSSAPPSAAPGAAPVPVKIEVLAAAPLERAVEGTGALAAIDSAVLRPEIAGLIEAVLFEDGQPVTKGQPLVRLRSAEARAALLEAEARSKLAGLDLERKKGLVERGDAAQADLDRAEADAELARSALIRAQEAVRKTTISAPFDGVVGLREVAVGELVDPSRRVTHLESLARLVVDVALAETALGRVRTGQVATVTVDALPGAVFEGSVSYVSPRVAEASRTVDVRVSLSDPESRLRPGMTARARVVTERIEAAILIPTEAVSRTGGGMGAYIVDAEGKAELRPIKAGDRAEARLEVVEGLAVGDRLVVEGLARLRPGAAVSITEPAANP